MHQFFQYGFMALLEPSNGILRTNVSWDDLQKAVYEAFGNDAKFGPNKDAKDIGFVNGFLSKICLITPDWQTELKHVPEKFVVKISSQMSYIECHGMLGEKDMEISMQDFSSAQDTKVKQLHNNEVTLYRILEKYNVTNVARPKVYYMREFSEDSPHEGFIIMEYVADRLPLHIYDNLTPSDISQVLRTIASLQVAFLKFSEEDKALFTEDIFGEINSKTVTKEHVKSMVDLMRKIGEGKLDETLNRLGKIIPEIADTNFADHLPDILEWRNSGREVAVELTKYYDVLSMYALVAKEVQEIVAANLWLKT
ncbi:hypothetical protein Y032_0160g3331 [Ancylostoma ceylanicum]|uniref:CHK kinase-like domain-containing protein n=1 Tax=Ancylostoma ceylanicum TaxID=53326 RepID=A0A016SY88_9BILA|nr:hypothetical protein Y032_0160g3331 [Ancylostoma ceylanicum]